jgi:phosphatidate cytidylyltransferase
VTDRPFWDRGGDDEVKPVGEKTEGVRIIGAEEAAEALERGDVAPRRGEGELKYGDRPARPPEDAPRPAMRFPLPAEEAEGVSRPRVTPTPPPPPPVPPASMPHWADPPTGEVPRILPEGEGTEGASEEDLDAWSSFATSGPRWRDQGSDWADPDYDAEALAHDAETRVGSLDDSDRRSPDDFFGFDEQPAVAPVIAADDEVPVPPSPRPRRSAVRPRPGQSAPVEPGRDMRSAVVVGVGFVVAALVLFSLGPGWAMILVTGVVVLAAAELFAALQRGGYQPATLLGLVATAGLVLGAHWKGETAIPLVLALATVFSLLWYLVGVTRVQPTMNAGVTVLGVAQVGLLGSFAALILGSFPNGIGVLWGVIVAVVANDVGALFFGKQFGKAPLAPAISPNKTIEGTVGGAIAGILVPVFLLGMIIDLHPWDTGSLALLGVVVAVVAPMGDLTVSMLKRDLGIKDMGSVLPGHGGLLDRFDALLFALPATYYLCRLLEIF